MLNNIYEILTDVQYITGISPKFAIGHYESFYCLCRCTCLKGWENGKDTHCEIPNILDEHLRKCVPGWMGDKCQHQCLNR
jgi:hypothetical protein